MIQFTVDFWEIIIAAAVSFVLGWIWYGPLFGKQWMKLMGFTSKSMKSMKLSPVTAMILGFISYLVMAWFLAAFISATGASSIFEGIVIAFWIWLGFIATTTLGGFLWEGKPAKLYILNAAYHLLAMALMSIAIILI